MKPTQENARAFYENDYGEIAHSAIYSVMKRFAQACVDAALLDAKCQMCEWKVVDQQGCYRIQCRTSFYYVDRIPISYCFCPECGRRIVVSIASEEK